MPHSAVKVHVNRVLVELSEPTETVAQMLIDAAFEGADWDVFELRGEGDPSGGKPLKLEESFHFKNGQHFRVLPGNRNLGAQQ